MEENVKKEMETLSEMWGRWLKSDYTWAVELIIKTGKNAEEGEWDFLRGDWIEKFNDWMLPYVTRMGDIGYLTDKEIGAFVEKAFALMNITLELIYKLEVVPSE